VADPNVTVPVQTSVEARVIPEGEAPPVALVTMWADGIPVQVPPDAVPVLQGRGFLAYSPDDLVGLAVEVEQYADQLKEATSRFVDAVTRYGYLNGEDGLEQHTMLKTFSLLTDRVHLIHDVASQNYQTLQSGYPQEIETEVNGEIRITAVDPADPSEHANAVRRAGGEREVAPPEPEQEEVD